VEATNLPGFLCWSVCDQITESDKHWDRGRVGVGGDRVQIRVQEIFPALESVCLFPVNWLLFKSSVIPNSPR